MTAMELYKILNDAGLDYEVREIFDGLRVLNFEVEEEELINEEV
jgi:hypothetical protein